MGVLYTSDVYKTLQPLHITSNQSVESTPTDRSGNPSKLQHDGVPTMWIDPLWHLLLFALHPHSLTNGASIESLTSFIFDNNQQQTLQTITCTEPRPLWTSELGTTCCLTSGKTSPWKAVWCYDQSFAERGCVSASQDQQCHPTSSCRVDPT